MLKNLRIFSTPECGKLLLDMSPLFIHLSKFDSAHVLLAGVRTVDPTQYEQFIHYRTVPLNMNISDSNTEILFTDNGTRNPDFF
jgi:hypothetical protein